jgi:glycerophosphoryl diester phosphodiesterase
MITFLIIVFLIYIFLVATKNRKEMDKFKSCYYAHRGLHNAERAENSMSAFKAAVDAGYGIELDIRLSKDGKLVVFHDDTLNRVCGREGKVIDFTADELATFSLCGTADGIPLFSDVLALIDGKIPLLVEIKEDAGDSSVSLAACEMLRGYKGDFIVESFNPVTMRVVKKNMPEVCRGILSRRYLESEEFKGPLYLALQALLLNCVCRPAFIAYNHKDASALSLRFCRRFLGSATIAWTVRSAEEEHEARKAGFDGIIFENYIP